MRISYNVNEIKTSNYIKKKVKKKRRKKMRFYIGRKREN